MASINFFTPVHFGNQSITCHQAMQETVDDYFYLGGKKASVIDAQDSKMKVVLLEKSPPFLNTCLKVLSYFTLIIPTLMLIAKTILRMNHFYKIDKELTRRLPSDPSICAFYEKQGILKNELKLIPDKDLDSLGLSLEEKATVDPAQFMEVVHPLLPQESITLWKATKEVVAKINETLQKNAEECPNDKIKRKRFVCLNDCAPGYKDSSKIHFYSQVFGRMKGDLLADQENLWLNRILRALIDHGHIYSVERPNNQAYYIQA